MSGSVRGKEIKIIRLREKSSLCLRISLEFVETMIFAQLWSIRTASCCDMTCLGLIGIFLFFFQNFTEMKLLFYYSYQSEKMNNDK